MTVIDLHPQTRKEKNIMKLIPIGVSPDVDARRLMRAEDFSDRRYDGIELRTDRQKNPVVIMHSKETDPLRWKVVYGFSQVFFRSFAEAVEFCNSRGFQLVKDQVD